jgi:Conserved TM helix
MDTVVSESTRIFGTFLPNVIGALLILIVGWLVAMVVAAVVKGLLGRTDLDNRIARSMGAEGLAVENTIGRVVFWLIMLFVLVAFFQALNLAIVSEPLNQLLTQVTAFLPRLVSAAVLLLVAWVVATVLKRLVTGVLGGIGIDRRLGNMVDQDQRSPQASTAAAEPSAQPGERREAMPGGVSLSQTLGEVVYWLVFLLFLPAILSTLALEGILEPVQTMLNQVLGFVPNLFAAALILLIGWFVARIVQRIVTGLLAAVGVDRLGDRVGLSQVMGGQTLSGLLGLVVYVFILLPVLISALDALRIEAISRPATNMLNTILTAIPNIFAAAVVLLIAYVVGRLVSGLVSNLLAGIGFNTLPARLGLGGGSATVGERTPSDLVGALIMVAIMLFATIEAVRLLGFGVLADLLAEFTTLFGQIIMGLIIFGVGLYFANLAYRIVRESDVARGELLPQAARIAIIALSAAMALRQMGLANEIVSLAFGLVLGAVAVAVAIAFGLGGREIAARELQGWVQSARSQVSTPQAPPPPPPPSPTAGGPPSRTT